MNRLTICQLGGWRLLKLVDTMVHVTCWISHGSEGSWRIWRTIVLFILLRQFSLWHLGHMINHHPKRHPEWPEKRVRWRFRAVVLPTCCSGEPSEGHLSGLSRSPGWCKAGAVGDLLMTWGYGCLLSGGAPWCYYLCHKFKFILISWSMLYA